MFMFKMLVFDSNMQMIFLGCLSPEYLVIIKYYSKLIDTLAAKKLSHYFVSHKIISTKEEEEIIKPGASSVQAATFLLGRIIKPLRAGFENCTNNFYVFLDITEQHGNVDIKQLSTTIRKEVTEMKSEGNFIYTPSLVHFQVIVTRMGQRSFYVI